MDSCFSSEVKVIFGIFELRFSFYCPVLSLPFCGLFWPRMKVEMPPQEFTEVLLITVPAHALLVPSSKDHRSKETQLVLRDMI